MTIDSRMFGRVVGTRSLASTKDASKHRLSGGVSSTLYSFIHSASQSGMEVCQQTRNCARIVRERSIRSGYISFGKSLEQNIFGFTQMRSLKSDSVLRLYTFSSAEKVAVVG